MTRYPKKGKGSKWTAVELKAIPAAWKGDKLSEEGLQGEVRVAAEGAVTVRFLTPYKWEAKLAWFYCGTFPQAPLEAIREARDWCRDQVKAGVNPSDRKKLDRIEAQADVEAKLAEEAAKVARDKPLREMVADWLDRGVKRQDDNVELRRILDKDVLSTLGDHPVRLVGEKALTQAVKAVAERGSPRMAVIVFNILVQMYGWANKREPWRSLLHEGQKGNPMEVVEVRPLLPKAYDMDNVCERVLSDDEIRGLRDALQRAQEAYESAPNKRRAPQPLEATSEAALWICLGTLCRIGELTKTEWKHVDFLSRTWFIPRENTKEKQADLKVSLSDFALRYFKALHKRTGHTAWAFPSKDAKGHRCVKTVTKQVGDRQVQFSDRKAMKGRRNDNSLVIGEEAWTPHDLRRTGATLMQRVGVLPDLIDRCQNHVMAGSKVRRHYLQYDYADEMRDAWERLGTRLEAILGETPRLRLAA